MEIPVVRGLVAQIERELFVTLRRIGFAVKAAELLQLDGALAQPIGLRHFFDQQRFGDGSGLVFGAQLLK